MSRLELRMMGAAWRWRYRSISSERQLPNRRMTSMSTFAHSKALAPAAQRHRALTSDRLNPSEAGDWNVIAWRSVLVIMGGIIFSHRVVNTRAMGSVVLALLSRRWSSLLVMEMTGHRVGQPLLANPMTSPRTPFFCRWNEHWNYSICCQPQPHVPDL